MIRIICHSVNKSCPSLCDPMKCSVLGFPVLHHLPELAQTHVHWVGNAIEPSHPLSSPSPVLNLSQHQHLFQWVVSLQPHRLQHARLLCPPLSPGVCSVSTESAILSNHLILCHPLLLCFRSFPAWRSLPMSQLIASGNQSIGASASVLPMNIQDWFPLVLTGLISLLPKGL